MADSGGTARFRESEERLWESLDLRPRERWLDLATVGTTVRVQEVGDGPPVVFVHGATTSGSSWASLVAELDGFRCILLDRPGSGLSDPRPRPSRDIRRFEAYADVLVADVLDALGLERAHVVGTSLGGYLALRGAAAHPDRVARLVAIGFPFGAPMARVPLPMRLSVVPGLGRALASLPPTRRAVVAMLRQVGLRQAIDGGRMSDEAIDSYHSLLRDTDTMRNELAGAPSALRPIRGVNTEILLTDALLSQVVAPTLFVWGEEDLFGGTATARAFTPRLPAATLEIVPGAGHAPWMDDAPAVAAAMAEFLRA